MATQSYKEVQSMNDKEFYKWCRAIGTLESFAPYQERCIRNRINLILENGF